MPIDRGRHGRAWVGVDVTNRSVLRTLVDATVAGMNDEYEARPEHRFTFGLWTVGNRGRDPFGHEVRPSSTPSTPCTSWPAWARTA